MIHLHNIPKADEIIGFKDSDLGDNILKKRRERVTTEVEEALVLGAGKEGECVRGTAGPWPCSISSERWHLCCGKSLHCVLTNFPVCVL